MHRPPIVDIHCHLFSDLSSIGFDPTRLGAPDRPSVLLDAGTFGPENFALFAETAKRASTGGIQVYGLVNVARLGLQHSPEISALNDFQPMAAADVALRHPEVARGLKLRAIYPSLGLLGISLVDRTIEAAAQAALPVMVHLGQQGSWAEQDDMLTTEILDRLRLGDIVSHVFTANPGGIFQNEGSLAAARRARARGVLFEVGHGASNFDIDVARRAAGVGFPADLLGSDVSGLTAGWLTLPLAMASVQAAGFNVDEVVSAVTTRAAAWLNLPNCDHRDVLVSEVQSVAHDSKNTMFNRFHSFEFS